MSVATQLFREAREHGANLLVLRALDPFVDVGGLLENFVEYEDLIGDLTVVIVGNDRTEILSKDARWMHREVVANLMIGRP
jgi:hypothetical protein